MSLFLSMLFSLWLLLSSVSHAQTELNNPACILELSELSPDTLIILVNFNLPDHLKIPLIDLTRLRIKLAQGSDETYLSNHYLNELKKLKEAFLAQGYTETFFDETRTFFFHELSQSNETFEQTIETKKLLAKKQKDDLNYPLKGRTPQVIDEIVATLQIPEEDVTIHDLERITTLNLNYKKITELREGDFQELINLKILNLHNNQLTELPQNLFQGLGALQWLSLNNNQLTGLPQALFQGLGALEWLDLSSNQLTGLPQALFQGLRLLKKLHLSHNLLTALSTRVFQGLGALEWLYLNNNQLTELPQYMFWGLSGLMHLDLSNNQLSALPTRVFQGLGELRWLYLSSNPISVISEVVFSVPGLNQNLNIILFNLPLDESTKQMLREKYWKRIAGTL